MRLAIYVDDIYRRDDGVLSAGLAFPLFAAGLAQELDVTLLGRLDPVPGRTHHVVPAGVEFVPLPHYADLSHPLTVARGIASTLRRFWTVLGKTDAIWLLGPHPLALLVVPLALARCRRVVLGIRQNTRQYALHRYPHRSLARFAFALLEASWRVLARVCPIVVVGPELARLYARAPRLLELVVSFVDKEDIVSEELALGRDYRDEIRLLSVGRLDPEKNPLLLADVLAELAAGGYRVRLIVCGEGPLEEKLRQRLRSLGVADRSEMVGYLPLDDGLLDVYRSSHVFVHVSLTEGVPQVLLEAWAARLPTVATDVGAVAATAGDAAMIVKPRDANGAAEAVRRVVTSPQLRARLIDAGVERLRTRTRDAQLRRLAAWLRAPTSNDERKRR